MHVDDNVYQVRPGSIVYVPGNSEHGIWNVSGNDGDGGGAERLDAGETGPAEVSDLRFLYVFAVDGFEEIKYRFS